MAEVWVDFYRVLQVHFTAEPDIIAGAYHRLSKKYHPDVNKSARAEDTMKRLNAAYQVLSDARKRAAYDIEWTRRAGARETDPRANGGYRQTYGGSADGWRARGADYTEAGELIRRYYGHISDGDYASAYECISEGDRKHIKKADFIKWQNVVGRAVELRGFDMSLYKKHLGKRLGNREFTEVFEFTVHICERDIGSDRITNYSAAKNVVREDGGAVGVYLGYRSLKPFIAAFEQNAPQAVDSRSAYEHWFDYQSKHDGLTGMMSFEGFEDAAGGEISRHRRYDNIFSLVLFEVVRRTTRRRIVFGGGARPAGAKPEEETIRLTGRLLAKLLRDTDIACRWKDGKFIALLAETDAAAAGAAVNRVCAEFNNTLLDGNSRESHHALYAGICLYDARSLRSTLKKCAARLALAKRSGRGAVAGFFTRPGGYRPSGVFRARGTS